MLKTEAFENWRTELCIKENTISRLVNDMEKEYRFGQMDHDMKVIGHSIKLMDKAE